MAKNPAKGNLDHGYSGKHESVSASEASDSMWTNPVARITPAAKALAATKRLPSVWRKRRRFPKSGIAIPVIPAKRIDAIATNLRTNAVDSSRQSSTSVPPQLESAMDSEMDWKSETFLQKKDEFKKFSILLINWRIRITVIFQAPV